MQVTGSQVLCLLGSFLTESRGKKERYMLLRLLRYAKITKDRQGKTGGNGTSLCVDAKAGHLGEIRGRGEVEDVHVIKNVVSVETAKNEEPRVSEERSMIATWRRRTAKPRARLVL
jgi:hypothetical protein